MKETSDILQSFALARQQGKKTALVSVVHVDGSSYRRPGARMLINDEGQLTGAISGGCLEGDALRKALLVIAQQQSKLVTYDTTHEEDVSFGVQLGCAGVIQVLFEPIREQDPVNPVLLLQKARAKRQKAVLVTLFSLQDKNIQQAGTCLLMEEDDSITGDIPVAEIKEAVLHDVQTVMTAGNSLFKNYITAKQTITAFIEFIQPPVSLVVVGAGNDAIPLVDIATAIGWDVSVVDGRPTHAKVQRFTSACQVVVTKPEKALEQLVLDKQTAFVLMTHNYQYDLAMLKALLEQDIFYIGVLGPKKKLDRMLGEIREQGIQITDKQLSSLFGPVGLEIGAETAEEIAVSIVAEIKAVLAGKKGISLRESKEAIHARTDTIIGNGNIP